MILGRTLSYRRVVVEALLVGLLVVAGATLESYLGDNDSVVWVFRTLTLIAACAPPVFIAVHARGPWRKSIIGRALMGVFTTYALLLWLMVASWFLPDYPGKTAVRLLVYTFVTWALWRLVIVLVLAARHGRKAERLAAAGRTTQKG